MTDADDERSQTLITSPLSTAIRKAADEHPSLKGGDDASRSARVADVSATAAAMAQSDDADFASMDSAPAVARQAVDDAATALGMQPRRSAGAILKASIQERHRRIAAARSDDPMSLRTGFGEALAVARTEKALDRAMRIRSSSIDHRTQDELAVKVMERLVAHCSRRGASIDQMDDETLMQDVEAALDVVIAGQGCD